METDFQDQEFPSFGFSKKPRHCGLISTDYFTSLFSHAANAVRSRLPRQFCEVIGCWRANGVFDLRKLAPLFVVEFTNRRFWPQFSLCLESTRRRERRIDREFRGTQSAFIARGRGPLLSSPYQLAPRFIAKPRRMVSLLRSPISLQD